MKTARLIVLLVNIVILAVLAYAGVRIYFSNFFEQQPLTTIDDPNEYMPKVKPKTKNDIRDYEKISGLAHKPVEIPPPIETKVVPTTPTLNVSIKAVTYDAKNPSKSGAHLEASGISRYLVVGDNQKVADNMPYYLKEIKENKPDREWTLIFESEKGDIRQATYRMD